MTCADFLGRFSDYYDGLLPPAGVARYDTHKSECAACRRYAEVMDQSLALLREFPEVDPPEDLQSAVRYRIHVGDERELVGFGPVGSAAATRTVALVAVLLAFTAWAPVTARRAVADGVGPMVAQAGVGTSAVGSNGPAESARADEIQLAPFSAGQLSAPDDEVRQLWSYPNAMLYEYSSLSSRSRWAAHEDDSFIRAVGLE